jgi:hypothetical protein
MPENDLIVQWSDVETKLDQLEKVEGGFSNVTKGLLKLDDDKQVFVKIATEPENKKWTRKEIAIYRFLAIHSYPHIPKLLAANQDDTGFVLEALVQSDGWQWQDIWDEGRLNATLAAMKDLSNIVVSNEEKVNLEDKSLSETDSGWEKLNSSNTLQSVLKDNLNSVGRVDLTNLNFKFLNEKSKNFIFNNDTLVHYDIRSDNCAWNEELKEVRLIDWNWTQIGDTRIDKASLFTTVKKSGFDIGSRLIELDSGALLWMAGFWLAAASTTSLLGGLDALRNSQLMSGVTAFELATNINPELNRT